MHKCMNCGTEFEGNFCSECGAKWGEEKNCPKCGAKLSSGAKFCSMCGHSFDTSKKNSAVQCKLSAIWAWIKAHLKIVIPSAIALVAAIVLLSLIPTFILASVNGTYYNYRNGEFNEESYITLSTGTWTNGKVTDEYRVDGSTVTLIYHDKEMEALFGKDSEFAVQKMVGTVQNGVLNIRTGETSVAHYCKKDHSHKYGDFETVKEPTCTQEGILAKTCACGIAEEEIVPATGHMWNKEDTCTVCNIAWKYTKGLKYSLNSDGESYSVSGLGTASSNVTIPFDYNNKPVTSIGKDAFKNDNRLTSITIPNSVTSIGISAFENCSWLTSITIPNSVTSIGESAFKGCSWLTSITISSSATSIGISAFEGCSGLTSITIPNSVTSIGKCAFRGCRGLTGIALPEGMTSIVDSAFEGCSWLTSITIPNSVTSIGEYAFSGCSGLTSITIPNSVTTIGKYEFSGCSGLTSITIPNSVTSIGSYVFRDCRGLKDIFYSGTKAEWNAIRKVSDWDYGTSALTVHCSDGDIIIS